MRLIIAIGAAVAACAIAAPAAAQSKECKAFRSGPGWAVKSVVYTRADGQVFDSVTTTTYQVSVPETKGTDYGVNYDQEQLLKPVKGVVILEYGKRPTAEALGKIALAAPSYFSARLSMLAGLEGRPTPVFKHRLLLKAGPALGLAWQAEARLIRTPRAMEAQQFETAMVGLGSSDIEALGPGGLADARKAAGIIGQLARGGRVEIQVMEEGKPVTVGGFDVTAAVARAAGEAAVAARAEADRKAAAGQCVAG